MENNAIMLLSQLVNMLGDNFNEFERAYNASDKEKFEKQKKIVLEMQGKIASLLK